MDFISYQSHHIGSIIVPSFSKYYSVGILGGSSFGVSDGDGKGGVGPSNTHLTPHTVYYCIDGANLV